ncbi:hypothetical protein C494_07100 [Natronorubrum bangense JCM 10635]|uniref:Uncharacterized protein n=1 Tax=Natronorubrum bangense JCM 10635 TaxID=1227500 RepID=L9WKL1_9EURY|nr:hypothetical protein C494_07100 [Natronorubrum bangense JCM 10635]
MVHSSPVAVAIVVEFDNFSELFIGLRRRFRWPDSRARRGESGLPAREYAETGCRLAGDRHAFVLEFRKRFEREWFGKV